MLKRKRLLVLMAFVLVLSLGTTAFADDVFEVAPVPDEELEGVPVPIEETVVAPGEGEEMLAEPILVEFIDVSNDSWYYQNVMELTHSGIITGYEDKSFRPNNNITIFEFMSLLNRYARTIDEGYIVPSLNGLSVENVPEWANYDVNSVINRMPSSVSDKFDLNSLNRPITRQEVAYFVANSFNFTNIVHDVVNEDVFTDVGPHTHFREIEVLVKNGVLSGYPDGTFRPTNQITRAEVATVINKLYGASYSY